MRARSAQTCEYAARTESLGRDELVGEERQAAELHLADCDDCRAQFRQRTSGQLPRIRNYTLVSELGRGGFGVVYKALHHGKGRFEAVKVLFGQTDQRTAFFENEVRLVARLRHPNIATLYEASLNTTPRYYTMELVTGHHLDQYFHDHDVSLEQRIRIVKTVASAVDYAHREGVIHRDLKPQNVLIDPTGEPRIVDFGIAKRLDGPPGAYTGEHPGRGEGPLGTFGYIAPEQLAGKEVDWRADVFALGALLFHVITGQPARFATEPDRLRDLLRERRVSRADDLAAIIACCVDPAPEQRYHSAGALVDDLERFLSGRPIHAQRSRGLWYRTRRVAALTLRTRPLAAQVTASVLLAVSLSWLLWMACVSRSVTGPAGVHTTIVGVTQRTFDTARAGAIGAGVDGFDPNDRKSWRLLYGEFMRRVAPYGPRVVVWDYFFPDCHPTYDAGFLASVRALDCPVVVGARDVDVNGVASLCPDWIDPGEVSGPDDGRAAAARLRWGLVSGMQQVTAAPGLVVPLAMKPGWNEPVPTLGLAAWAALQYDDAATDLRVQGDHLAVRYRRTATSAGQSRWYDRVDLIPLLRVEATKDGEALDVRQWLFARYPFAGLPPWADDVLDMSDVFLGEPEHLRAHLAGKVLLIGQMLPPYDQHSLGLGQSVFGCQLQAVVLNNLLNGTVTARYSRVEIALRVCAWSLLALLLAQLVPVARVSRVVARDTEPLDLDALHAESQSVRRPAADWCVHPPRWILLTGAGVLLVTTALFASSDGLVETLIGTGTVVAVGGVCLAIRSLHDQQLRLAPSSTWRTERSTPSTTVLAGSAPGPSASV